MIVDLFKECKMDVLVMSKTKMKVVADRECKGEKIIISGVPDRCRAHEGISLMIKRRSWGIVEECKCVSCCIMRVRLKVAGRK